MRLDPWAAMVMLHCEKYALFGVKKKTGAAKRRLPVGFYGG
jgi:hypothetical protein